jgi:hypothetical protein
MDRDQFDEIAALWSIPSDVPLTSNEAAKFLRCSPRLMEVMRRQGNGPKYSQPMRSVGGGANKRCLYLKRDLLAWIEAGKVGSVAEATFGQRMK